MVEEFNVSLDSALDEVEKAKVRRVRQAELREAIKNGTVDIGPTPVHQPITQDTRNATDPDKVGERLMRYRQLHPDTPLSEIADTIPWDEPELLLVEDELDVPDYIRELQHRSANGDKFAISMLEHFYEHGTFQGALTEPVVD
jgi:hypothetical protein